MENIFRGDPFAPGGILREPLEITERMFHVIRIGDDPLRVRILGRRCNQFRIDKPHLWRPLRLREFPDEAFAVAPGPSRMFPEGVMPAIGLQKVLPESIGNPDPPLSTPLRIRSDLMGQLQARSRDVGFEQSQDIAGVGVVPHQFPSPVTEMSPGG